MRPGTKTEVRQTPVSNHTYSKALIEAGFDFVTGVPDSDFIDLIADLESGRDGLPYACATREDNALGLAAGACLSGASPLVFMESSGLGNTVDAITSLAMVYSLPLVLLISWAGYKGRDLPHHNAIGIPLPNLVAALGLATTLLDDLSASPGEFGVAVESARSAAVRTASPALLLGIPSKLKDTSEDAGT